MESPTEHPPKDTPKVITAILGGVLFFSSATGQTNASENAHEPPLSVTAVAVAEAYSNAYRTLDKTQREKLPLSLEEIDAQNIIASKASSKLSATNIRLFQVLSWLPKSLEQSLLNTLVEQSYGNLLLLRKSMIKQQITKAINEGTSQIVFLGAGLDVRGFYTAKDYPHVAVFELDQAAMHKTKQELLHHIAPRKKSDETAIPANLHLMPANVTGAWFYKLLLGGQFDATQKTLYIAEGLTMYLSEEENIALLRDMQERLKPEDSLLISYLSQIKTNPIINTSMQAQKEQFDFALTKQASVAFLTQQGLSPEAWFEASQHLKDLADMAGSDYFADKNKPQEYYLLLKRQDMTPKLEQDLFDYRQIKLTFKTPDAVSPYHTIH